MKMFNESKAMSSRRKFLGEASCAMIGTSAVTSSVLNLSLLGRLAASDIDNTGDYRALVCVFLNGGNDSFNMIAPGSGDGYTEYADTRAFHKLPPIGEPDGLLPLNGVVSNTDNRQLGVHPQLPFLQQMYNSGNAAIVANVGTLVEPTSLTNFNSGLANLPVGLFSHSDQAMQWQTSLPDQRSAATGWGGRLADLISELNGDSRVSMSISGHGQNIFQTGRDTIPMSIGFAGAAGSVELSGWNTANPAAINRQRAIESLLDAEYQNAFERVYALTKKNAIGAASEYEAALALTAPLTSSFSPGNRLSSELENVARTIAARDSLCKRRQIFFVQMDGYDLHNNRLSGHAALLGQLNEALTEFNAALEELGVTDQVTTYSSSDFGRTLAPNGTGTDHAWGGNQFVFGGAVDGGRIYGEYPSLALGSGVDTGRGRLIPSTSVDEFISDLAIWMGVSNTNLPLVLPNLSRFHDSAAGAAMGYML